MTFSDTIVPISLVSERSGVPEKVLEGFVDLARQYELEGLWLFGSRARGTHMPWSDIDLACIGRRVSGFAVDLDDDLSTPLRIDVVDLEDALEDDFLDAIQADLTRLL